MNNPYAWSIPESQIAHRIHCHNEVAIEEERVSFADFCALKADKGICYRTECEAWEAYCFQNPKVCAETVIGNDQPTSPFDFGIEHTGWVSDVSENDHWIKGE
jgi:hypothetical protein